MDFNRLRISHPQFVYQGFEIDFEKNNLKIVFDFKILPDISFKPEIIFPQIDHNRLKQINPEILRDLIFNLGMIELLSYWKATCSPEIIIRAGFLNQKQIDFWDNLLIKGMGEFFFNNQIDFTMKDLVKFKVDASMEKPHIYSGQLKDRDFILVGGGKDSALTLDILVKSGREVNCFSLNPAVSTRQIIKLSGLDNPIYIQRNIDPKLLELNGQSSPDNKKSYLNGHTPFSAYLAFISVIGSVLYDYKNIILSNESSSNEGNLSWKGAEINHQYSKTFEFENLFRNYCKQYLSENTNYFSFLRPLSELQISGLFAKNNHFFSEFRSCNRNSKLGTWCGKCPKCISTYLSLYPFLGEKLVSIFDKDLFQDESIIPIIHALLRLNNSLKPFECVSTVEETKLAIYLSVGKVKAEGKELPLVLKQIVNYSSNNIQMLKQWNSENNLTEVFKSLLESKINETA